MHDLGNVKYSQRELKNKTTPSEEEVRCRLQLRDYKAWAHLELSSVLWFHGLEKGKKVPGANYVIGRWHADDMKALLQKMSEERDAKHSRGETAKLTTEEIKKLVLEVVANSHQQGLHRED